MNVSLSSQIILVGFVKVRALICQAALALTLFFLLVPIAAFSQTNISTAQINFETSNQDVIVFKGWIDRSSVSRLVDLLSRWQSAKDRKLERPTVKIESPGGDVEAALIAGRALREAKATVLVLGSPREAICSSSCVLIVAGAVERYVIGGLGIHSFFVASEGQTLENVAAIRRRVEDRVRTFLKEMNVSNQLYDRMLAVPPQSLRLLTEQERDEFGLGISDPTFRDFRIGEEASRRGINKYAYVMRLGSLVAICGHPPSPPLLIDPSSATRADLVTYRNQLTRYETKREELERLWNECKEDVLNGRKVK